MLVTFAWGPSWRGFVVKAEEQHTQVSQDRMPMLIGRTILPRADVTRLEMSSSQSNMSSRMPGAVPCGDSGAQWH